ncbi:bacteriohemerythrin [Geobacter argillaceus]|uniref:Hemerythrin n=1 Tax=Geobacter argillaceus TaxID=345631 RepID=A0A562W952_9BACT|nr:bacteriohemerythrin [Geobacter argillaceus]TWJ26487.1 hemerythrin [Geobacter argillaceus]
MPMIEWNSNLATGIDEIDDQHKELFSRVNLLMEACNVGKGREEVSRLLQFLSAYVRIHFESEEQIQVESGYPGYPEHKLAHQQFSKDIERLNHQFTAEGAGLVLVIETNQMVAAWLTQHISKMDKALAVYLRDKGMPASCCA